MNFLLSLQKMKDLERLTVFWGNHQDPQHYSQESQHHPQSTRDLMELLPLNLLQALPFTQHHMYQCQGVQCPPLHPCLTLVVSYLWHVWSLSYVSWYGNNINKTDFKLFTRPVWKNTHQGWSGE